VIANVSAEQLAQLQDIIKQLDRVAALGDDSKRRRSVRMNIRMPLTALVLVTVGQPSIHIFSRNISTCGIGFVSRRPFKIGEPIAISIRLGEQPSKLVLTKTTFCRYLRSGLYEMGGEFVESILDSTGKDRIPSRWLPSANSHSHKHPAPKPPA
jgi:hypothetical protein